MDEAAAVVPARPMEPTSLYGPRGYSAVRIAASKEAGVAHLPVDPVSLANQTSRDLTATVGNLVD